MNDYTNTPKLGETRIVKRFAWLPVDCGTQRVWFRSYRQLERYTVIDRYDLLLGTQKVQQWVVLERYCL